MRSITRLFGLSRRLPHRLGLRSFSETPTGTPKIGLRLSQEEMEQFENDKLEKATFMDLAKRLADKSHPASVDLSEKVQKDLSQLFSLDDLKNSLTKEFESTRNLNKSNHDLINLMRHQYHKNQEGLKTMHQKMTANVAAEKAAVEQKFALSLISTINALLANAETIRGMTESANADLVNNTLEGIKLIEQNAMGVLRRFQVVQIPVKPGDAADPEVHVLAGNKDVKKGAKVKRVTKLGFRMKDKVIAKAEVELE